MSIKWMYEELTANRLDGTALLLLLDLSLHADNAGTCTTTFETLASYCGLDERRVRRLLRTLHQHGYIIVTNLANWRLEIRVNCLQMLRGDPAADGSPALAESKRRASKSPFPPLACAPNWN